MNWEEAIQEAKSNLGYGDEYVSDWDSVVEEAKDIISYENEEDYDDFCEEAKEKYNERLKSNYWKELRDRRLKHDEMKCKDCGEKATEVHHKRYVNMDTPWEFYELISLCRKCHERRHNITHENQNTS